MRSISKNNDNAKWSVISYPFAQGKYELMIVRNILMISIVEMCKDRYDKPISKCRFIKSS